jgi:hypothetical protein
MFVFDRNFSYDTDLAGSETNLNRVQTPPIPEQQGFEAPTMTGRLWRRMSEPVNDLPKHQVSGSRTPIWPKKLGHTFLTKNYVSIDKTSPRNHL